MSTAGEESHREARRTLANKLEHLFRVTTPAGKRPPSHQDVAAAINIAAGEKTISATYVWQLRTGKKDNPTKRHLEALARYFGVSPAYFLDDEESDRIDEQLSLLQALKEADVRNLALRANELSSSSRQALVGMISRLRELEGLSDADSSPGSAHPDPRAHPVADDDHR